MNERTLIAWGGKTLYGARVGILMLETRFPRIPGDMGNAETLPFPVLYKVVPGASPQRVVCEKAEGLLDEFLAAAAELVRQGADGITTTCGFLSLYQRELAAQCGLFDDVLRADVDDGRTIRFDETGEIGNAGFRRGFGGHHRSLRRRDDL